MANFNPPFSNSSDRRFPTSDERQQGFDCGPADQDLFNGMFHRLEAEIGEVIAFAGLTGTDADLTQLRQAIVNLIEAATGGGDPSQYLLVAQARARLPIFPEVQTSDRKITVITAGSGTIRIPGGVTFLHRGIFPVTTTQTDFPLTASKVYHVRWNPTDGFVLRDLSNATYNPGGLAETSILFDSGYDDMLVARVVTNSSNIITITNLANANVLTAAGEVQGANGGLGTWEYEDAVRPSQISRYAAVTVDFARTPQAFLTALNDVAIANRPSVVGGANGGEINIGVRPLSRYQLAIWGQGDVDIWTGWGARA